MFSADRLFFFFFLQRLMQHIFSDVVPLLLWGLILPSLFRINVLRILDKNSRI